MIFSVIADSDIVFESLFSHNIFGFKKLYFNEFDLNVFDVNVFSLNITVDDFRSLSSIFSSPNVCLPSSLSYPPSPPLSLQQIGVGNPATFMASPNANICLQCEQTVNFVKILIGEPGVESQIKQDMLNLCQNLGPLKDGEWGMVSVRYYLTEMVVRLSSFDLWNDVL